MSENGRDIKSDLRKVDAYELDAESYIDAPELSHDQLAKARIGSPARRGRPPLPNAKQAVKLRLDADVLQAYRAGGTGWQTRLNDDLRKARKLKRRQSA